MSRLAIGKTDEATAAAGARRAERRCRESTPPVMPIRVEFYGIARLRAGAPSCELDDAAECACLGELLQRLERLFPTLARECLHNGRLCAGYLANLDGRTFVTDPATPLVPGQAVLILSSDAGG